MDFSPQGEAVLVAREGRRLTAYKDSVGVWTIGVGHTTAAGGIVVRPGLTITAEQCDAQFARDIERFADAVRKALSRPVPQPFFDACTSAAYNFGPVGFAHSSIVRLANAGDLKGAAEAFLMWRKPASIIPRREAERDQALLASYAAGPVYARRGDFQPVKVPIAANTNTPRSLAA